MYDALHEALATGGQVVTPTRRLARRVIASYDTAQLQAGRTAWRSAEVLPWDTWVALQFDRGLDRGDSSLHLLSPGQERELWRELIRSSNPDADAGSLTQLVREAWRLQHEWRVRSSRAGAGGSDDVETYAGWSERFAARCRRKGWITHAELGDWLASRPPTDLHGRQLVFYAFDRFTPQQEAVLDACAKAGAAVRALAPPAPCASVMHCSYDDPQDESTSVARKARALLESGLAKRIGIVVPDLSAARARWLPALDAAFDPGARQVMDGGTAAPYNLSLGVPLQYWPAVRTLMLVLRFAVDELPLERVGELLSSPYLIAGEREFHDRALFDALLRERGGLVLGLEEFVRLLAGYRSDAGRCASLESASSSLLAAGRGLKGKRPPSQWLDEFHRIGDVFGWPGERPLESSDMQVVERCRAVMSELAAYDLISGPVEVKQALGMLARIFAETIFQPESPDVPVQVLGVLESAGIDFDHLFVTGLSDQAWPGASHPNVLLPLGIQRALGVPHSSVEWEWDFCRRMMDMWAASSGTLEYSSVRRRDDQPMRSSALLRGVQTLGDKHREREYSYLSALFHSRRSEVIPDALVPVRSQALPIPGGTGVLKDQSACPFRAFALHRLGARELESGRVGLDARDRGVLIHAVLEAYAREVPSWRELHSLPEQELGARIDAAVSWGMSRLMRRRGHLMPEAFQVTEASRLRRLLASFVDLERQRPPFRVLSRESHEEIQINGLTFKGRPDRIDEIQTDAGGVTLAVIDYKTGRVSVKDWFGRRPAEPQLPLYALARSGPVGAVAFVSLRSDRVAWSGVGTADDLIAGVSMPNARVTGDPALQDWNAVWCHWHEELARLAGEFSAGVAAVDPRDGRKTCRNCRLETLCRIDPLQTGADGGEDDVES